MRSRWKRLRVGAAFAASYAVVAFFFFPGVQRRMWELHKAWTWSFSGRPDVVFHTIVNTWPSLFVRGLVASTVGMLVVFLVRSLVRTRFRADGVDRLEGMRRWTATKPRGFRALLAAPSAVLLASSLASFDLGSAADQRVAAAAIGLALGMVPAAAAMLVMRALAGSLLAPTVDESSVQQEDSARDRTSFYGVAVTLETRAAVAVVGLLSLGVLFACALLPVADDWAVLAGMLAQPVVGVGAAFAFGRASRVRVGLDGVLVTGTSRTRFFCYRELDEAGTTPSGEIQLRRHGRSVLRIQLHGDDADSRDAIVDRIRQNIARAKALGDGGSTHLPGATSVAGLAQAARGEGDYRAPAMTREQLWDLVEGPSTVAAERARAAKALFVASTRGDLSRLRVAADRCAEPAARAALLRVAGPDEPEHEDGPEQGILLDAPAKRVHREACRPQ